MRALELRSFALAAFFALTAACSSSGSTASSTTPGDDSGTGGPGPGNGGNDSGTPTASSNFKTHVILGDSISDRGGMGPFYYDLLDHNDDNAWPDYKGKDLSTKLGSDIKVVKNSKAGATSIGLTSQVKGLPTTLDSPVVVTITIGGNDVQNALGSIVLSGNDTQQRTSFTNNLDSSLAELTKPGRFGDGVVVKVLLVNIYDPSDGTGNFKFANGQSCGQPLSLWNKGMTDPYLTPWEDAMTTVVAKYPVVKLLDLRTLFHGHGVPSMDTWFVSDCIHPNHLGHNALRGIFWDAISSM